MPFQEQGEFPILGRNLRKTQPTATKSPRSFFELKEAVSTLPTALDSALEKVQADRGALEMPTRPTRGFVVYEEVNREWPAKPFRTGEVYGSSEYGKRHWTGEEWEGMREEVDEWAEYARACARQDDNSTEGEAWSNESYSCLSLPWVVSLIE